MTATYDDVAVTLPTAIVDSIATSMPCPVAGDHRHLWQEERIQFGAAGEIISVRADPYWWCAYCRVVTGTAPIPPVNRPWEIIPAEEIP